LDLILISESKLKVTLSAADMKSLSLSCEEIDYDNTETRRAFWNILDEAKHKTGFDAAANRVFIQVYPSKGGGCELYVTKLTGEQGGPVRLTDKLASAHSSDRYISERVAVSRTELERSDDVDLRKSAGVAAEFDTLSQMTACCRRLTSDGYLGASYAYCDQNRRKTRYLLLLDGAADHDILREYGIILEPETIHIWVGEHCAEIRMTDAVETLSRL
jgi:Negative regulator of genetic competence, sporulation and motility